MDHERVYTQLADEHIQAFYDKVFQILNDM